MSYPTHDTDWALSAKGNWWRRINGKVLVVGRNEYGFYWVLADGTFLEEHFETQDEAQLAAEAEVDYDLY